MAKYDNTELLEQFGIELKLYRYSKGIDQNEFADMLGVTRQYLSEIEKGHEMVNMPTFIRLIEVTNKYAVYMLLKAMYGNDFLELDKENIDKIATGFIKTIFENLKGEEPIDLTGYYGKDDMRVTPKRKAQAQKGSPRKV